MLREIFDLSFFFIPNLALRTKYCRQHVPINSAISMCNSFLVNSFPPSVHNYNVSNNSRENNLLINPLKPAGSPLH